MQESRDMLIDSVMGPAVYRGTSSISVLRLCTYMYSVLYMRIGTICTLLLSYYYNSRSPD